MLLLLYTDVNYQNEQNMFNVIDATRPMHAIYLACRVSLLGLALLLGFALLLGTSFSAASHWPGGTPLTHRFRPAVLSMLTCSAPCAPCAASSSSD